MERWTRRQVEKLAPDDRSVKAAKKLARPGPWSDTGSTDELVWGKCQGSGRTPYQVAVDLTGPAARCTCPSRKFPCKHGLALLLLWVEGDGSVAASAEPASHAAEWADGRSAKAAAKAERAGSADDAEPADPAAQARRLERRLGLMTAGAADFEIWLADLYRHGLAAARQQPYSFWDQAAARLLDAQLPGLASRVRAMPAGLHGRDDWADRLLVETGRWFSAVRAWRRRDELSDTDRGNLRAFIGWPVAIEDLRSVEPLEDRWVVEGVHRTDDGRLQAQRTWLRGEASGERLLTLDFAAVGSALGVAQTAGTVIASPVVPYPGAGVRRAFFPDGPTADRARPAELVAGSIDDALDDQASRLAANPFLDQCPTGLRVRLVNFDGRIMAVDRTGAALPLLADYEPWQLLAVVGGDEIALFAEIDDGELRPLTVELDGEWIPA